jgi:hypothetical protein
MDRVADAFAWPFRDPDWPRKLLIIALTLVIPIIGGINGLGWMLATLDRLRAGDETMAPAGLGYIGRGFRLFVVQIAYGLAISVVALLVYLPAVLLAVHQGRGEANAGLIGLALFLNVLAFGVATIGALAVTFASPAFVLATDHAGIAGGLNVREVVRRSRANLTNTLIAGLMLIAAGFISSIGVVACGVGVLFTAAYALAVQAWIFRSFEMGSQAVIDTGS